MKISVAIVGCGYWGKILLRNFFSCSKFKVEMVVEKKTEIRESITQEYSDLKVVCEIEELLSSNINLVVLATEPHSHYLLGKQILESGKNLLVEKPMTMDFASCRDLNRIARQKNLKVFVDHTDLFNPGIFALRKEVLRLPNDSIKQLKSIRKNKKDHSIKTENLDVLWDLAPHDFSIANYLLNQDPNFVKASQIYSDENDSNLVRVEFEYESGDCAEFLFSNQFAEKIRTTEIALSEKTLLYEDRNLYKSLQVYEHKTSKVYEIAIPPKMPLQNLMDHVFQVLSEKNLSVIDGLAGEMVVRLIEAAIDSIKKGGAPVSIETSGDLKLCAV